MASLVAQSWVTEEDPGKSGKDNRVCYRLTPTGEAHARALPGYVPPPPLPPLEGEAAALLLMELFIAGDSGKAVSQLVKSATKTTLPHSIRMEPAVGGPFLTAMQRHGWIEPAGGKIVRLSDAGKRKLAAIPQHPQLQWKLTGSAINELLRMARASLDSPAHHHPAAPPEHIVSPLTDDALIEEAKTLLRERHGRTGFVPIFELRHHVEQNHGAAEASHAQLDARLRRLRAAGRLRLVSISDRSRATPEQLSASIPGEDELFFYVRDPS
jgi:DNA-binding PadR family transcriptional regulator